MIINYTANVAKIFEENLEDVNLSRKKFIIGFISGLIETGSVKFTDIAAVLNDEVQDVSNLRRIQSFFSEYQMDYTRFAIFLMSFIPLKKLELCIDRTNWKFGAVDINFLVLTVYYKGVGIPIIYELLEKRGNSNQSERIDVVAQFVKLFGIKRIAAVVGDREFIGEKWYKYLIKSNIPFYMRIPKSHRIEVNGILYRAEDLLPAKSKQRKRYLEKIHHNGVELNIAIKRLSPEQAKKQGEDYLIIVTNSDVKQAFDIYYDRWSIEVFFQSIKKRGLNLEDTHLTDLVRLKKLFTLVALAFAFCLTVGVYLDENVKEIRRMSNGYKLNSFFKEGLNRLRKVIRRIYDQIDAFEKVFEWIYACLRKNKLAFNLHNKIIM